MRTPPATGLAVAILLASTAVASAQAPRNGPEWGGKNHQPTQAEVAGREDRAGVRASPSQKRQDDRTVEQIGRELLYDEDVELPRDPARPTPP